MQTIIYSIVFCWRRLNCGTWKRVETYLSSRMLTTIRRLLAWRSTIQVDVWLRAVEMALAKVWHLLFICFFVVVNFHFKFNYNSCFQQKILVWNFNNGHCLKILRKDNSQEITDLKYTRIYNNKFIVTVGWDRRINIYDDNVSDVRLFTDPNVQWADDIVSYISLL